MKRHVCSGACIAMVLLAGWAFFGFGLPGRSARAAAVNGGLKFDRGIGFYVYSDGQLTWLDYPIYDEVKIRTDRMLVSRSDFRMFAYGLDFSRNPIGLPPHLFGYGVMLQDVQFNLDSADFARREFSERQGPYAVHFIPLPGYEQPVYEITCDLWDALRKGDVAPAVWGFKVRGGDAANPPDVFWFTFRSETN